MEELGVGGVGPGLVGYFKYFNFGLFDNGPGLSRNYGCFYVLQKSGKWANNPFFSPKNAPNLRKDCSKMVNLAPTDPFFDFSFSSYCPFIKKNV